MIPSTAAATNRISHDTNHAHGLAISSRESSDVPRELPRELPTEAPQTIGEVLPTGCIIELGGQAASTVIAQLLAEVQRQGEPVAWVTGPRTSVYPPDLDAAGVDLTALAFLRIGADTSGKKRSAQKGFDHEKNELERLRAAELLLRSGAFGLVVIEAPEHSMPVRALSRLHAMARRHGSRVVLRRAWTWGAQTSLGPLVALRLLAHREQHDGRAFIRFDVQKNKLGDAARMAQNSSMRWPLRWPAGVAAHSLHGPLREVG